MELIGIWPEPGRTDERLSHFKALIYLSIITIFGTGPQSANLFFIWGNLELVTENLSTANIPGINAMIKLIFAWYYKDCTYKERINNYNVARLNSIRFVRSHFSQNSDFALEILPVPSI